MSSERTPISSFTTPEGRRRRKAFGDLRSRVMAAMLLIALVPMSIVAFQGYHCARQGIIKYVNMHLVSVIEARKALLNEWLKERADEMEKLASLPAVTTSARKLVQEKDEAVLSTLVGLLDSAQASGESYESVVIYDLQWNVLAGGNEQGHMDADYLTEEFQTGVNGVQEAFFDMTHAHEGGNVGLHIGYPLKNDGGQKVGFLVANLNLNNSLTPLLQERSGLWRTGKVYIISTELDLLSEPFPSGESTAIGQKTNPAVLECFSEQGPVVREYQDYLGKTVLGTAMPFDTVDWILVAEMDSDEALEWLGILLRRVMFTVAGTLVLVLVLSILISKSLGRPLKQLARVARRIRAGHVDDRLPSMSGAEVEEVRQAFNEMLDELRRKQLQIIQSSTLATVGELSSSIVHEMRNPLSSIKMNLQVLSRKVESEPRFGELAEIASEQVGRVERMLDDLLRFGRPVELDLRPVLFGEICEETLTVVGRAAEEKQINLTIVDELDDMVLNVDKEQICRALSNLLMNAVQATPQGGNVTCIGRRRDAESGHVEIEVIDTGTGLSSEALQRVFKPFFTTKTNGTGLGLANVKKIAELHGGSATARNRPEGGAAIGITVPIDPGVPHGVSAG